LIILSISGGNWGDIHCLDRGIYLGIQRDGGRVMGRKGGWDGGEL
jgi:hypothetical protein